MCEATGAEMYPRDYRDMVGGAALLILGALFAWYATENYALGTLRRSGPGLFPAALGVLLAGFGAVILVSAFFRTGTRPEVRFWAPLFVLSGVAAFAAMIVPFGLIPAIVAVVAITSLAELKIRPVSLLAMCVVLSVMAWLVFRVGLGLPVAMFRWPF